MLSIYIDFVTLVWATALLVMLPNLISARRSVEPILAFAAVILYLLAQTGWFTSYFQGDLWGATISNFLWFGFNSCVMGLITLQFWRQ